MNEVCHCCRWRKDFCSLNMLWIGGASKQRPHPQVTQSHSQDRASDGKEAENGGEGVAKCSVVLVCSSGSESDMSDSDASDHSLKWDQLSDICSHFFHCGLSNICIIDQEMLHALICICIQEQSYLQNFLSNESHYLPFTVWQTIDHHARRVYVHAASVWLFFSDYFQKVDVALCGSCHVCSTCLWACALPLESCLCTKMAHLCCSSSSQCFNPVINVWKLLASMYTSTT